MVLDLLDAVTLAKLAGVLMLMGIALIVGYSIGHKDGRQEGYLRSRKMRTSSGQE